jgi:hypothetical protein
MEFWWCSVLLKLAVFIMNAIWISLLCLNWFGFLFLAEKKRKISWKIKAYWNRILLHWLYSSTLAYPLWGYAGVPGEPKKYRSVPIIPRCHGRHHSDLPYVGHSKVNSGRVIPTIFIRPRYQIYVGYSEKVYHVIPR